MSIFTRAFWRAAAERAIKSASQGAILAGVGAAQFDALHANWETLGGAALGAAVLSLLTSIASDALTDGSGPSLTNAEQLEGQGAPPRTIVVTESISSKATAAEIARIVGEPQTWASGHHPDDTKDA